MLKYCAGLYDAYVLGDWNETSLRFTPTTPPRAFEFPKTKQFDDGRAAWGETMMAADGVRRLYLGWVPPGVSPAYHGPGDLPLGTPPLWHTSTAMRELFYDARIARLTMAPLAEISHLHGNATAPRLASRRLAAGETVLLGAARQFDMDLNVTVGTLEAPVAFGVTVFAAADGTAGARVGVTCAPGTPARVMPGTDLPGDDYHWFGVDPTYPPAACAAACANDTACRAWTLVHSNAPPGGQFPPHRCCLKSAVPAARPNPTCVSGVPASGPTCTLVVNTTGSGTVPGHTVGSPVATVTVPLLAGETVVPLRVLGDRSLVEAFAVGGRAVATATVYAPAAHTTLAVWAEEGSVSVTGGAMTVGCAWVPAPDV